MNARAICLKNVLRLTMMCSLLLITSAFISTVNAAEGCGSGRHATVHGRCVNNHHYYHHQHCWRNAWGHMRCN